MNFFTAWETLTEAQENNVSRRVIDGLSPREYEHDLDRQCLNVLQKTVGLDTLVRLVFKHGLERLLTIQYTGSHLQIAPDQLPRAYAMVAEACRLLVVEPMPDTYVEQGLINAMTVGSEQPLLVFDSGCFTLLSRSEQLFIAGHELGHIKSGHSLYGMIARLLADGVLAPLVGTLGAMTLGLGNAALFGLECAFMNWRRTSELTADRAGLLCCQDLNAALRCLMKLGGLPPSAYPDLNVDAFKRQARAFRELDFSLRDKALKTLSILNASHPWLVMRAHELLKWHESGEYRRILDRQTQLSDAGAKRTDSRFA